MINFSFSRQDRSVTRAVNPSTLITAEGSALVADSSVANAVAPSAGSSTEVFAGVSLSQQLSLLAFPQIDNLVVGSDGTVTLSFAPQTGTPYVTLAGTAATAAAVGTAAGSLTSGQYAQAAAGSTKLQFQTSTAGSAVVAQYRFAPTLAQAQSIQGNILPGGDSGALINTVGVVVAGDIYTTEFDTTVNWNGVVTVKTGANGLFTTGGSGPTIAGVRVISTPTAANPFLGLSIYNG